MAVETTLQVKGMTCTGCENRVRTALQRLEGVVTANADHRAAAVSLRFDPERISEEQIKERIRAGGYDIA